MSPMLRPDDVLEVPSAGPIPVPKSFDEAMASDYASYWLAAMIEDIAGKQKNGPHGAWTETDIAEAIRLGKTIIKGKWVFKIKYASDGTTILKFKARWVGCGYSQRAHIDYNDTFASTIRASTVRTILAEAAEQGWHLKLVDVVKAFTTSKMDEEIYVEMPHGFAKPGVVCRLNQALEGTKQAAHLWQKNLNAFMIQFGFTRSLIDPCLYTLRLDETVLVCAVHVDDILCAYNDTATFEAFADAFKAAFDSTVTDVDNYLGMEVTRDRDAGTITLTQRVYIEKMFNKYLVGDGLTRRWNTPVDVSPAGIKRFNEMSPAETDADDAAMAGKDFNGLLGSLLYAACMTRPDIAFYTSYLSQFMQRPTLEAWHTALSVAAYLNTTSTHGVTYGGERDFGDLAQPLDNKDCPRAWGDASFGSASYPFLGGFIEWRNGPVAWFSRKAKFVPMHSSHVELAATVEMIKQALFVYQIAEDICGPGVVKGPITVFTDNKATRDVINNPGATKHTTHIERWLHYARDLRLRNAVTIELISTAHMVADIFTKPMPKMQYLTMRNYLLTNDGKVIPTDRQSQMRHGRTPLTRSLNSQASAARQAILNLVSAFTAPMDMMDGFLQVANSEMPYDGVPA